MATAELETINQEFDLTVTESAIAELADRYMQLTVADVNDKRGLEVVHAARMDVRGHGPGRCGPVRPRDAGG